MNLNRWKCFVCIVHQYLIAIFVVNLNIMKLVTYLKDGHDHLAMFINGMLYDMDSIHPELPPSMAMFLNYWDDYFPAAQIAEQRIKNGKKSGKIGGLKNKENKTGFCGMSAEKRSELGKRNSKKNKENMCGIFKMTSKELSDCGSKGGKKTFELKKGAFGISKEERSKIARSVCEKYSKLNGKKTYELGLGIFSLSKEEKIEISRKAGKIGSKNTNSQKWKCLVTGHISNPGGLSRYQKYRNIDVSQRVRLDEPDLDYNSKCDKIL